MKIKMRVTAAGPDGCYDAGFVYNVPDAKAKAYIAGGYATLVDDPAVEVAADPAPAVEKAEAPAAPEVRHFKTSTTGRKRTDL